MVRRSTRRRQGGGGLFTPYADYPTSMDQMLPTELHESARIAGLDAKFAELPAVERAAGVPMAGGSRSGRSRRNRNAKNKSRRVRGGSAPINAPSMILSTPDEEAAARLNPQWYTENTVIPGFRGPLPVPGVKGGRRTRRNNRKQRRAGRR
jgi:hypothetical protein